MVKKLVKVVMVVVACGVMAVSVGAAQAPCVPTNNGNEYLQPVPFAPNPLPVYPWPI